MEPFSRIIEQSNQAGVGFLMVELDSALTFLEVAGTTSNPNIASRNRDHAHEAYVTILRYADRVRLENEDKAVFEEKFSLLRQRLIEAGYSI